MRPAPIPLATYRLQFNRHFTFRDAADLVPYLAGLGISHCYASPYLRARPGSTHGYDIIDHNCLNPEIGSAEDYEKFVSALHQHGMGQILDVVPNHMGVGSDNAWWLDVLENGEASQYADFFDMDWQPIKDELQGKVLIPVLGDQYGSVLDRGELKLGFGRERGEFNIFYQQHKFPVDPKEYPRILGYRPERLQAALDALNQGLLELQSLLSAFNHLPGRQELEPEKKAERLRDKEIHKRRLAALCARSPEIATFIEQNCNFINGVAGDPKSFDDLHELIKAQAYRLAYWRVAADDINYRRFFDVNDLAGLRMENEGVFEATHRFMLDLLKEGKLNGLRIDHPDGLYNPAQYFQRLQNSQVRANGDGSRPVYVVAEKILAGNEKLPETWPIDGTTGYEFANLLNGLFVDSTSAGRMDRIYRAFSGRRTRFDVLVYRCKKLVMHVSLTSELNVLANLLSRIALANRHTCDFTVNSLRDALSEIVACFPVYRTYVSEDGVSDSDREYINHAVDCAKRQSAAADASVFDFIREVLLTTLTEKVSKPYHASVIRFAMKFQQFTSAVMAKGLEDTSFYRYNRLISLNEVGGDPRVFGVLPETFHQKIQQRMKSWPHSMLDSSTHDTKRSEDVRARINVLSEIPVMWRRRVRRWRELNQPRKRTVGNAESPSRNDEYALYQTLIGAWPLTGEPDTEPCFCRRIHDYMLKAIREAKEKTSWANPNPEYESAMASFVREILSTAGSNPFLEDFLPFQQHLSRMGMFNSLSQTLIKLTAPGVPDIYQGNELWDFSLVDPDNRRPVDYARRQDMLRELQSWGVESRDDMRGRLALSHFMNDSQIKLYLIWKTLAARNRHASLFQEGGYLPLAVEGVKANHLVAFARKQGNSAAIVAVPRFCAQLLNGNATTPSDAAVWKDTRVEIPFDGARFKNVFSSESIVPEESGRRFFFPAARLLADFPVALLVSEES